MRNEFKTRTRKRREMWPRRQRRKSTEKQSLRKEQKGKGFRVRARKRAMRGEWMNIFAFCILLFFLTIYWSDLIFPTYDSFMAGGLTSKNKLGTKCVCL